MITLIGLALLAGSSWALGSVVSWKHLTAGLMLYERMALHMLAGLGLTSVLLSLLTLAGAFSLATPLLAVLSAFTVAVWLRHRFKGMRAASSRPAEGSSPAEPDDARTTLNGVTVAVVATVIVGCLGAIAPVTDDDALAYGVPVARRIAETGTIAVWPDRVRSMWPQSQQVLLAYLVRLGSERLGALTALEWLLCAGVVSALARRVCRDRAHVAPAMILALGSPVVAFQVASAKEDLLAAAATAAAALCLVASPSSSSMAAAGLFAGIAAGAKYPGAAVVAGVIAWPFVMRRRGALREAFVAATCAGVTGGLWYALNGWRYGNPVAPFLLGAAGTPLDRETVNAFVDSYGIGRGVPAFLTAPFRIFLEPELFCGRANLYNPIAYAGLAAVWQPALRKRTAPLLYLAGVIYIVWFFGLQNARLLWPATILLSPSAADALMPSLSSGRVRRAIFRGSTAVALGIVCAVGAVRVVRYAQDPGDFLRRETQNYVDLEWMNQHLDPGRHRVASDRKSLEYLTVPWLFLNATHQIEIRGEEMSDPRRFIAACRRQGITHLFGSEDSFAAVADHIRPVYRNPSSRRGGVRFFREPPVEATAVLEILDGE